MGFFIGFLTVMLVIVSLLMVLLILMQRPKQEGLGAAFGGGMMDQAFGPSTTNVLQKGTVYLAIGFFVISMTLAMLVNGRQVAQREREEAILSQIDIGREDLADPSITGGEAGEATGIPDSLIPSPSPLPEDADGPASAGPSPQPAPTEPDAPTTEEPATPGDGSQPSTPGSDSPVPAEPTDPAEESAEPIEPTEPAEPIEPTEPAEPIDPTEESAGATPAPAQ